MCVVQSVGAGPGVVVAGEFHRGRYPAFPTNTQRQKDYYTYLESGLANVTPTARITIAGKPYLYHVCTLKLLNLHKYLAHVKSYNVGSYGNILFLFSCVTNDKVWLMSNLMVETRGIFHSCFPVDSGHFM